MASNRIILLLAILTVVTAVTKEPDTGRTTEQIKKSDGATGTAASSTTKQPPNVRSMEAEVPPEFQAFFSTVDKAESGKVSELSTTAKPLKEKRHADDAETHSPQ